MSAGTEDCRHARLHIGGDPDSLPPAVAAHVASCADCSRFRDETRRIDGQLRAALEVPLATFRKRAHPARRFALAASIALAVLVSGGVWFARSTPALADEVVLHVAEEPGSWGMKTPLSVGEIAAVLRKAGVEFDTTLPVVYASACPFHGRRVPHLVVQTENGPMTVMLLSKEKVTRRQEFAEGGYRGVLLPAGEGSVVVLARAGRVPEEVAGQLVSGVHYSP